MRHIKLPAVLQGEAQISNLLRYALEEWLLIITFWLLMHLTPSIWMPLWIVALAGRFHALGVILHDACHKVQFKRNSKLNLLEMLAGLPIATTWNAMRYHHLRHHQWAGTELDPYFKPSSEDGPFQFMVSLVRGFLLIPSWIVRPFFAYWASSAGRIELYQRWFLQEKSNFHSRYQREVRLCVDAEFRQIVFGLFVLLLLIFFPRPVIIGYVLPLILAGVINVWRVLVEHKHFKFQNSDIHQLQNSTRARPLNSFVNFILFPRHIGYHLAHHLFPTLALENLPRATQWLETLEWNQEKTELERTNPEIVQGDYA